MNLSQLNELDFENVGSWPVPVKIVAIGLLSTAILALGYWQDTQGQLQRLEAVERQEVKLKAEFERKQAKAVNLESYKQQMREIRESFGTMLRQLPSKTEVAELLVDVTQTGLASGLEFELFKPQAEEPKDFYAELPIALKVTGDYHEFGRFVSGVAALPRIVTLHDITIVGSKQKLTMQATAKTYRYLDAEEIAAQKKNKKKAGRTRRK